MTAGCQEKLKKKSKTVQRLNFHALNVLNLNKAVLEGSSQDPQTEGGYDAVQE